MQFSPLSLHAVKDLSPPPTLPSPGRQQALGHSRYISYQGAPQKRYIHIYRHTYIGLAKAFFPVFHKMVQKNSNKLFGQPKTCTYIEQKDKQRQRQTEKQENRWTDKQKDRQAGLYIKRLLHEVTLLEAEFRSLLSISLRPRKAGDAVWRPRSWGSWWYRFQSGSKVLRIAMLRAEQGQCWSPISQAAGFIQPSSALFYADPQWTEWCPPTVRRTTCCVLLTNSCASLFWKHLCTHAAVWASLGLAKLA